MTELVMYIRTYVYFFIRNEVYKLSTTGVLDGSFN